MYIKKNVRAGNISNIENIENQRKATQEPYFAGSRLFVRLVVAASRKYVKNKHMPKTSVYCVFFWPLEKPISLLCSYYLGDGNRGPELKKICQACVFLKDGFSDCGRCIFSVGWKCHCNWQVRQKDQASVILWLAPPHKAWIAKGPQKPAAVPSKKARKRQFKNWWKIEKILKVVIASV